MAAARIAPDVIAKLIKFKLVQLTDAGLPQLTARGEAAYAALESGDGAGDFPELEAREMNSPNVEWPTPILSSDQLPTPDTLVIAWKPIIDGWDIVLGRKVVESPTEYTHWLPMLPPPAISKT